MINLMYLVFISMLALNVSVEVLDGFKQVDDRLGNSSETLTERNERIMEALTAYNTRNPEKAGEWHQKGVKVRVMSDSLAHYIRNLKWKMVREADGKKGDIHRIKHRDDLEAASVVMLSPLNGEGKKLRGRLDTYRESVAAMVTDPGRKQAIERNLNTSSRSEKKSWEAALFEQMPLAAAITLLSQIENDVRASEGEALTDILNSVDMGDFRVNRVKAHVIPESNIVFQGGAYRARIVLTAEDSTVHPRIFMNGSRAEVDEAGRFTIRAATVGSFPVEGYVEMSGKDGFEQRHEFSDRYTVVEPMATVAPTLMNVLYAGIDNEISISVPGIAPQEINATMSNGILSRKGNRWIARPATVGQNSTITVSARTSGGTTRQLADRLFRVRALPDPTPFLEYRDANGNSVIFKGGSIAKSALLQADGIKAAIDDGILNIPFRVERFRTLFFDSMGNAIPEISDGDRFSDRQKEQIRRLTRGSYFYISGVRAAGPDGTEREIAVMEVKVN